MTPLLRPLPVLLLALAGVACSSPTTPQKPNPRVVTQAGPSVPEAGPEPKVKEVADPPRRIIEEKEEDDEPARKAPAPMGLFPTAPPQDDREKEVPPEKDPPLPKGLVPLVKDKPVLFFEKGDDGKRRVHLMAEVCLREGPLEVLLCKAMTKEHESIMRVDVDARMIHTALIAAGAMPGSPVQFFNPRTEKEEYKPATGTPIKVTLTYHKDGKLVTAPAQTWIRDARTKKDMAHDWVFAGSRFFKDPENPNAPDYYTANNGEVIAVANFVDSMLDLPVKSPRDQADLLFEAHTARIPPPRTKVLVTLEPVLKK